MNSSVKTGETLPANKKARNFLLFLLGFLSIGAMGGGIVLIISPSGELLGMPLSTFKNMPFDSFLIPGIILFTLLGLLPALLIFALIRKPESGLADGLNLYRDMHWSWTFSIYIGFALIGWIHIQLIFLQAGVFWLHTFYLFYGIFLIIIALLPQVRALYKK